MFELRDFVLYPLLLLAKFPLHFLGRHCMARMHGAPRSDDVCQGGGSRRLLAGWKPRRRQSLLPSRWSLRSRQLRKLRSQLSDTALHGLHGESNGPGPKGPHRRRGATRGRAWTERSAPSLLVAGPEPKGLHRRKRATDIYHPKRHAQTRFEHGLSKAQGHCVIPHDMAHTNGCDSKCASNDTDREQSNTRSP